MKKDIAIIGLGKFGTSLATYLSQNNCNVIAIDKDRDKVNDVADDVAFAATADVTNMEALKEVGVSNVDIAVVCISSMEESILITVGLKELNVPFVIAKATNAMQANILKKVGADKTVVPEAEMGVRLAKNILGGMFLEIFEISDKFSIVEVKTPKAWVGHSVLELRVRERYGVNIVAIKSEADVTVNILPDTLLNADDILMIVGNNTDLREFNEG